MKKNNYEMFAVALGEKTTNIIKFTLEGRLPQLASDDIQELVEWFAEEHDEWKGVLAGKTAAVIFDRETLEQIRINKIAS